MGSFMSLMGRNSSLSGKIKAIELTPSSILDPNNVTIPPQIPRAAASTSSPASPHNGLSTNGIVANSVVVPVAALAVLAYILFWFVRKKRKEKKTTADSQEPNPSISGKVAGELSSDSALRELDGDDAKKELGAVRPMSELDAAAKPVEFPSPPPAIELDATPKREHDHLLGEEGHGTPLTAVVVSPMTDVDVQIREGETTAMNGDATSQ